MTHLTVPNQKRLLLLAGRSYPGARPGGGREPGRTAVADAGLRLRQRRDLRPLPGVGARGRCLRAAEPHHADQQVDHGAADHDRRAQARLGQAHHRDRALLRVRAAGQEAPRPRAHLRPPDRRPVQDRGRRSTHDGRSAHLADPGLLRRPGRPPVRDAPAVEARAIPCSHASRSPWSRPMPAACASPSAGPMSSAPRWRSSTSAAIPTCPTRSRCSRSWATSGVASASSSTT